MSKDKLYAVKNDEDKYWDFERAGFWRRVIPGCYATISKMGAGIIVDEQGGHVVTLVEETKKVVLTKEQAETVERAHTISYPAYYISVISGKDEELLMDAYVNGYTVAKETKYYVKVLGGDRGYLNIYSFNNDEAMIGDRKQNESFQVLFTATEIEQLKQRDDIALDWDKVKLIEVDDKEIIDGESDF